MATCKDCIHYEDPCEGFIPSDLDSDVFDYFRKGIPEEIPDIDERCGSFKNKSDFVEVVRCKDCKHYVAEYCTRDIKSRTNMFYMVENDFCSYGERRANEKNS